MNEHANPAHQPRISDAALATMIEHGAVARENLPLEVLCALQDLRDLRAAAADAIAARESITADLEAEQDARIAAENRARKSEAALAALVEAVGKLRAVDAPDLAIPYHVALRHVGACRRTGHPRAVCGCAAHRGGDPR